MTQQQKPALSRKRWIIAILAGVGLLIFAAVAVVVFPTGAPPTAYRQARQARDAITRGDYATARRITESVLTGSRLQRWRFYPFEDFMSSVSDVYNPGFGTHVAEWIKRDPSDPLALLIGAEYDLQRAWFVRGTDWVSKTETRRRVSFTDYLDDALDDVDRSIQANARNPYAYYLKLQILHGFGLRKDLNPQFRIAVARFPNYFSLYEPLLETTEPRWGGSIDAMYAFVDQYAGHAPNNSPLKLLYVDLYGRLLEVASEMCSEFPGDRESRRRCVETATQQLIRPEMHDQLAAFFSQYDSGDQSEFDAAVGPILSATAGAPFADADAGKLLATAAAAMHSDNKLDPSNRGQNNYAVDDALSNYWHTIGVMDFALKKAKDALLDVENTHFPSVAEKSAALVEIYEQMARLYTDLGKHTDAIAAEKAALSLGIRANQPDLLCINTYGLKDYARAIAICSELIADHPGNMENRFWRGQAYSFSQRRDQAEIDLEAVAESSSPRRADAAMSIAMIHAGDQDFRGAVAAFHKYPYLFDPRLTSGTDVAMAYYNRCYANWKLGALQDALDDCNQSIKFDSTGGAKYMLTEIKRQMAAK